MTCFETVLVADSIRQLIEQRFQDWTPDDQVFVHSFQAQLTIHYLPQRLQIEPKDRTVLNMICYPTSQLAWLSHLQVATPIQGRGHGQGLATLGEAIALQLDCFELKIRPLSRAQSFWEHMGYCREPGTSQVMSKRFPAKISAPVRQPKNTLISKA